MKLQDYTITILLLFTSFVFMFGQVEPESKEWKLNTKIGNTEAEIFKVVQDMPRFPGCENLDLDDKAKKKCAGDFLNSYVDKQISFSEDIHMTAVVQFIIGKDGESSDIHLIRPVKNCDACNEELLNIFDNMPTWIPGSQSGRPVNVVYTYPIKIKY